MNTMKKLLIAADFPVDSLSSHKLYSIVWPALVLGVQPVCCFALQAGGES